MSASRTTGACELVGLARTRYRNRAGALRGLDRDRQLCASNGIPEALRPVEVFRCLPRHRGGCNGWHLRLDARAAHEHRYGPAQGAAGGDVVVFPRRPNPAPQEAAQAA